MNSEIVDEIANSLKNEVILLNLKWKIYKELFSCTQRQALLSNVAPILFTLLQKLLLDDIVITLCRITDQSETRTKSGAHQNNTLYQLLLRKGLDKRPVDYIKEQLEPLIKLRNKFIAHMDLDFTIKNFLDNSSDGSTTFNLNFPLSLDNLGSIIERINSVMNQATGQCVLYNHIQTPCGSDGGVKALVEHLKTALFYDCLEETDKFDSSEFYENWLQFEHRNA